MKRVFISHPFADDPVGNKIKVNKLLDELNENFPEILFISPLHLFAFMKTETPEQRIEIMEICHTLIDTCDELWSYGNSPGCMDEYAYASETKKASHNVVTKERLT